MSLPAWMIPFALLIGAAVGSFLNVVIYRMPRGISLSNPKNSFCPSCRTRLTILDLFPLLSWLALRGKCRHCGKPVSSRYFWVELLTGSIWAGIFYQTMVVSWLPAYGIALALAAAALVAVIFIDWQYYIIPDQVNAFLFLVGIGLNIYYYIVHSPIASIGGFPSSLVGAALGVAVLWGIAFLGRILFRKDAMGHGDIKMARGIGAVLLPSLALMSFGMAVVLGAVLGVVQIVARRVIESRAKPGATSVNGSSHVEDEDEEYIPESIASLLKCGLGYLLCLDIIGLFIPKFYISYFGEDPFEPVVTAENEDSFEAGVTMIPFGPYLALGAILASVFSSSLLGLFQSYWKWAGG